MASDLKSASAVANAICGCATKEQHARDIKLIEAHVADAITEALARAERAEAECVRLRVALHDAIRRPMGVVPASADEFYSPHEALLAETRRMTRSAALSELIAGDAHLIDTVADSDGDDGA